MASGQFQVHEAGRFHKPICDVPMSSASLRTVNYKVYARPHGEGKCLYVVPDLVGAALREPYTGETRDTCFLHNILPPIDYGLESYGPVQIGRGSQSIPLQTPKRDTRATVKLGDKCQTALLRFSRSFKPQFLGVQKDTESLTQTCALSFGSKPCTRAK